MKKTRTVKVKVYVVEWFGRIQPVGEKVPALYLSKKEVRTWYQGEKVKIIPATITYQLPK